MEEKEEIAFKVLSFFIMVILGSFGLLYVYHRIDQADKAQTKRQSFMDFLSGHLDDRDLYATSHGAEKQQKNESSGDQLIKVPHLIDEC